MGQLPPQRSADRSRDIIGVYQHRDVNQSALLSISFNDLTLAYVALRKAVLLPEGDFPAHYSIVMTDHKEGMVKPMMKVTLDAKKARWGRSVRTGNTKQLSI